MGKETTLANSLPFSPTHKLPPTPEGYPFYLVQYPDAKNCIHAVTLLGNLTLPLLIARGMQTVNAAISGVLCSGHAGTQPDGHANPIPTGSEFPFFGANQSKYFPHGR